MDGPPLASFRNERSLEMHPLITTFVAEQMIEERIARASRERRFTLRRRKRPARGSAGSYHLKGWRRPTHSGAKS
jgi:hypothetical protein